MRGSKREFIGAQLAPAAAFGGFRDPLKGSIRGSITSDL